MISFEFIIYVKDQEKSTKFYSSLFNMKPCLLEEGMTEYQLSEGVKLGVMPGKGIAKELNYKVPSPDKADGIPRCELYFKVKDAQVYLDRGILLGAKDISPLSDRDWGDRVGYITDFDGHIIAFAEAKEI